MAKVVNVIDLGDGNYEVASTKNTIIYEIGKIISKDDVRSLISSNFDVNVKGPKEEKDNTPAA